MLFTVIITDYFTWHYTRAFRELAHVFANVTWFTIHFFSLTNLTRSLFSPWRRMTEKRHKGGGFENIAAVIIINTLSRLIGSFIRLTVILVGVAALTALTLFQIITYLLWSFLPLFILVLTVVGISLIISSLPL